MFFLHLNGLGYDVHFFPFHLDGNTEKLTIEWVRQLKYLKENKACSNLNHTNFCANVGKQVDTEQRGAAQTESCQDDGLQLPAHA